MFVNFSEEARHILKQAEKEKEKLNHPYVGSEHLMLSILKDSKLVSLLKKHKITYEKFKEKLISIIGIGTKKTAFTLYTPLLKKIIENTVIEAREENSKNISPELLIINILDEEDGVAYTILKNLNVNLERLYFDIRNIKGSKNKKLKKLMIEDIGVDITKLAKEKKLDPVIGREKEISKTTEILLRRKKNNPVLIGPAGVGKTAIVEGLANLIVSNNCPKFLASKRLISLNIFELVSGTKYRGEFEEKMKILIKELEENKDIILFIDEIHTIVGAGGAEGAIDASNILKPALARGGIRIIGATTLDEYKKFIEPDAALARRFQSVLVEEPDFNCVVKILKDIKPLYEKHHDVKIDDKLIDDIANMSKKYLSNRFEPDRSIDILDEVCAKASAKENNYEKRKKHLQKKLEEIKKTKEKALINKNFDEAYNLKIEENKIEKNLKNIIKIKKIVTKKDVIDVIKNKGNIVFFSASYERNTFYKNLEENLNSTVYGQEKNIEKLIKSLRKKEILKNHSIYSVLIAGSSGTGKTLFAQTFLKNLVNEKNIIKIDAFEYLEHHTISKLIGTTAGYLGYDNKNNVFEKIRTNPNTAIIVDNYDDACDEFKNLFMRILETGKIEDASGKIIDFSNSIIVFLLNASCDKNKLGFNNKIKNIKTSENELTSKVSTVINLDSLEEKTVKKIIAKKLKETSQKYDLIKIKYDNSIIDVIFEKLTNKNNLSNLNHIIESNFESKIIDAILDNKESVEITIKESEEKLLS